MTAIMQMLTFLGDHFYFVLIAFFEILAALALLVWPKCRRTAHAGAFLLPEEEQMLLQEIGRDASEVFLLMRRYDSMVLGAVGDVQALLGVSLQQLQDDVTAMYRNIKNPELGSRMAGTMTGAYRLAKTTPGLSQADLRDPAKLGLLKTDKIYYLDENAFARSRWLQKVWLPNELEGIYNTPFAMDEAWVQQGDTITVTVGENIPELMGFSDGTAFSFGVPDECLRLQVSENRQQALLEKWVPPLTGYATREKLWAAVAAQLGTSATQQQIEAAVRERMLQAENRLRAMMGLQSEIPEEASQASQSDAAQQEDDSTV